MFIGEQPDGSVTEIESRDADFLEHDFPRRNEVGEILASLRWKSQWKTHQFV